MTHRFDQDAFDRKAISQIKCHQNVNGRKKYDEWVTKHWDDLVIMYDLANLNIDIESFCEYVYKNSE
jgi:hypothetical protein